MSYVAAGYGISLTVLAGYAVRVVRRRRQLERALSPGGGPGGGA